jgi:hypothetical protein
MDACAELSIGRRRRVPAIESARKTGNNAADCVFFAVSGL